MREEGNSHQPDSESYAEEKPEQDTTQRRAEVGEDLGRASEARTIQNCWFLSSEKTFLGTTVTFSCARRVWDRGERRVCEARLL